MNPLSIRLDADVRKFYDEIAELDGIKTTQKIRSVLIQVARANREAAAKAAESPKVVPFPAHPELPLLLAAAEESAPREVEQ